LTYPLSWYSIFSLSGGEGVKVIWKKPALIMSRGKLLLIFWVVVLPILAIITARNNGLNVNCCQTNLADIIAPFQNGIGGMRYVQYDTTNTKPIYSFAFDQLMAENNNLGAFKIGLFKTVKISGLELKFYKYTSQDIKADHANGKITSQFDSGDLKKLQTAINNLIEAKDDKYFDVDLSNAVKVQVRGLDYSDYIDGKRVLSVQCRKVLLSGKLSDISLRGHVVIEAEGGCLESNNVTWDIKNKRFTVAGGYMLNRGESINSGEDICIDQQLNIIDDLQAKSYTQEE
jgi:hypothetical protein